MGSPSRQHPAPALTLRMLPPDFFTISSSTMDCRQMLSMMACKREVSQGLARPTSFPTHHAEPRPSLSLTATPSLLSLSTTGLVCRRPYLWTGDGDPLQPVLAHEILKSQLQLHLGLPRAAPRGTVAHRHLQWHTLRLGPPKRESGQLPQAPVLTEGSTPPGAGHPAQLPPASHHRGVSSQQQPPRTSPHR